MTHLIYSLIAASHSSEYFGRAKELWNSGNKIELFLNLFKGLKHHADQRLAIRTTLWSTEPNKISSWFNKILKISHKTQPHINQNRIRPMRREKTNTLSREETRRWSLWLEKRRLEKQDIIYWGYFVTNEIWILYIGQSGKINPNSFVQPNSPNY